jgi:hypothetical protein
MIRNRHKQFPLGTNQKLHARSAGPFKVLQGVGPNACVLDLPLDFSINFTFNIADLVAYQKQHPIPNDSFEMPPNSPLDDLIKTSTPLTLI